LECGQKLAATPTKSPAIPTASPPSGAEGTAERRQLTVMFCDLVGSTALSARLDPEDLREVIGAYHRCCAELIERHGGFIAKYMGDGVLAYFGYPRAHEDDAEQAVRAGLALTEAVARLPSPQELRVRVGVASGLVVVGDLLGTGSAQEQAIVGETPNLAARLQALAEPGAVVIADSTRRAIGGLFEVADLGPQSLKGFSEPQRAWRVLSENQALGRFEALRSSAAPLIGRAEELDLLLRRWAQAKAGEGRVVLLSAEAGIGKSRLAAALMERIRPEPHIRLRYFCAPHRQDSALYPIIAQMEFAAGFAREDAPEAKFRKLEALLGDTAGPVEDVAVWAELLSLPIRERYPPLDVSPQRKKQRTFEALIGQVRRLAERLPVLMVFEDIHWMDPSSRELFDQEIENVAGWRALLMASFRPEFQPPWTGHPHVTTVALTRLGRRETTQIVESIAGNHGLTEETVEEIVERADGVPLFAEELTKAVLEAGARGGADVALSATPRPALAVPPTLHASLMARLDRLGSGKDVAQAGAAIGRSFDYGLLAAVVGGPEEELRSALDRLTEAGLVFARGVPPQSTYVFKHALVQDAAYGTLLRGRRRALHRRIAEALEAQFPDTAETQPELLAHHLAEAGLTERAVDYCLRAGRRAMASSAMAEAVSQLRRGLQLIPGLPDTRGTQERELDLQIALGRALTARYGSAVSEVAVTFARARRLCERLWEKDKLVLAMFGEYCYQGLRAGRSAFPPEVASGILDLGEAWNDSRTRYLGHRCLGVNHFYLGEFAAARAHFERALALYEPEHRAYLTELTAEDPHSSILMHFSWALACLGHLDQARARCDEGIAEARRSGKADVLGFAIYMSLIGDQILRSPLQIRLERADELIALSAKHGFLPYERGGKAARAECLALSANAEQAIAPLQKNLAACRATGVELWVPWCLISLAGAYGLAGLPQEGLNVLAEADEYILPSQGRWWVAELHRLRGDLLRSTGDDTAAEESFQRGLAVARRQEAKLIQLRAATGLARLRRHVGKRTEARDLLAPIYGWFTEGFDAPDLKEAKSLLEELTA
jgi:class 3 adenylate cyclase/tetratricopeptide (TPR) repeat protein